MSKLPRRLPTSKRQNLTGYVITYQITGGGGSDTVKVVRDDGSDYVDVVSIYGSTYRVARASITDTNKDSSSFDQASYQFQMYMF
jgi:hypothetical protein